MVFWEFRDIILHGKMHFTVANYSNFNKSGPNVYSLDYGWYLRFSFIIAPAYVRAVVIKPGRVPERHRKPRYPQIMQDTVDLLTATETKDQVKSRLLLDVVVAQCTPILQLLTSKDQTLLIRWNTLLVLDL
jgi:hypothetical protein